MAELHVAKTCIVKKKCHYELVKKKCIILKMTLDKSMFCLAKIFIFRCKKTVRPYYSLLSVHLYSVPSF